MKEGGDGGQFISTKTKDMFMNEQKREGRTDKWPLKNLATHHHPVIFASKSNYVSRLECK